MERNQEAGMEEELLRLLLERPEEGLAQAIDWYGGAAKTICANILGSDHAQDVEECVSDCFVRLWQNIGNFDPAKGTALRTYFYGIARNTALSRRRALVKDQILIPVEENEIHVEDDVAKTVVTQMEREIVQHTVDGLPPPDREIFIYRYFFYEPVKEIARKLDLTAKQVENRLARGKRRLREQLMEGGIAR